MYIPQPQALHHRPLPPPEWAAGPGLRELLQSRLGNGGPYARAATSSSSSTATMTARDSSQQLWDLARRSAASVGRAMRAHAAPARRSASQNLDATIGIIVGVLLGVFLIGSFVFLYFYGESLRRRSERRRHRGRASSSKASSKSSKASDSGGGAASAPPAAG